MTKTNETTSKLAYQRAYRKRTGNACTWKYEKTVRGFLMRAYRNMLSRTQGLVKPHLYKGLGILDKEAFYEWSLNDVAFNRLFRVWAQSGYDRKLSPSVNRIDPSEGYTITNIEWVTHSVNSAMGSYNAIAAKRARRLEYKALERIAECLKH